jgi:four helix bundle protein
MSGHKSLRLDPLAFEFAMEALDTSKKRPVGERFPLTDQIRLLSGAVAANRAEGFRERRDSRIFVNSVPDADGDVSETLPGWISRLIQEAFSPTPTNNCLSGMELSSVCWAG